MGLFKKDPPKPPKGSAESLGQDPQELVDMVMPRFIDSIEVGLSSAGMKDEALKSSLVKATSALVWESLRSEDENLLQLVLRICESYEINVSEDLSDDKWGDWLLHDVTWVVEYRNNFLARGKASLERSLSLLASTQTDVLKAGPKFERIMAAVQRAAGRELGKE